jgi:hypothetical protein
MALHPCEVVQVTCPTCCGGKTITPVREIAPLVFEPAGDPEPCWTCNGTGIVTQPTIVRTRL